LKGFEEGREEVDEPEGEDREDAQQEEVADAIFFKTGVDLFHLCGGALFVCELLPRAVLAMK